MNPVIVDLRKPQVGISKYLFRKRYPNFKEARKNYIARMKVAKNASEENGAIFKFADEAAQPMAK